MSTVIEAHSVSKKYRVQLNRPLTLKESIIRLLKRDLEPGKTIWALQDVNLPVEQGIALGIVGHNGAGKSTLLRLLCGIGRPTKGQINRVGQVSGLLELGSGFHPDLTGRENIMTGGLLNGLTVEEIKAQESDIISFAELEQFIDQPIRTYSSGMYLRLAFSTSMHFDPDVLIIDEVLAVGDTNFQKKCYEKLLSFRKSGKTLILTSHDLDQIRKTCDDVVILEEGKIVTRGEPESAIQVYHDLMRQRSERRAAQIRGGVAVPSLATEKGSRIGTQEASITSVNLYNAEATPTNSFETDESMIIELKFKFTRSFNDFALVLGVYNDLNVKCFETQIKSMAATLGLPNGSSSIYCHFKELRLLEGCYFINVGIHPTDWEYAYDYHWQMHPFYIISKNRSNYKNHTGIISLTPEWSIKD
jgi:lipopolysaccharide transport system ATP-binding protein